MENLGKLIAKSMISRNDFGQNRILYTHFNSFSPESVEPKANSILHTAALKSLHPLADKAFSTIANMKYNLDGKCAFYQRVWCVPLSVSLRFVQARERLERHVRLIKDTVLIESCTD